VGGASSARAKRDETARDKEAENRGAVTCTCSRLRSAERQHWLAGAVAHHKRLKLIGFALLFFLIETDLKDTIVYLDCNPNDITYS
jgi:hypothetical protein